MEAIDLRIEGERASDTGNVETREFENKLDDLGVDISGITNETFTSKQDK